jgi:hypothetical protein
MFDLDGTLVPIRSHPVNVSVSNRGTHPAHSFLNFRPWHGQPKMDGVGDLIRIIGIHDQRVPQITRGTSEPGQDENTLLITATHHEFLGHQVHAVMEGSDKTQISTPVKGLYFAVRMVLFEKDDGLPVPFLEFPVDSFDFRLHFCHEIVIPLNQRPAPQL